MLSWRRQICYWTLSLDAVLLFKLFAPPTSITPSSAEGSMNTASASSSSSKVNGTSYTATVNATFADSIVANGTLPTPVEAGGFDWYGLLVWSLVFALVIGCCLQDARVTREESVAKFARRDGLVPEDDEDNTKVQWPTSFTYYPALAVALVCMGYVTHLARQTAGYGNLLGPYLEQECIHLLLAYIMLAEVEHWRLRTPSAYMYKSVLFAWEFDSKEILKYSPTTHVCQFWVLITIFVYVTRLVTGSPLWGLQAMLLISGFIIMVSPLVAIPMALYEEVYKSLKKRETDLEMAQATTKA